MRGGAELIPIEVVVGVVCSAFVLDDLYSDLAGLKYGNLQQPQYCHLSYICYIIAQYLVVYTLTWSIEGRMLCLFCSSTECPLGVGLDPSKASELCRSPSVLSPCVSLWPSLWWRQ